MEACRGPQPSIPATRRVAFERHHSSRAGPPIRTEASRAAGGTPVKAGFRASGGRGLARGASRGGPRAGGGASAPGGGGGGGGGREGRRGEGRRGERREGAAGYAEGVSHLIAARAARRLARRSQWGRAAPRLW